MATLGPHDVQIDRLPQVPAGDGDHTKGDCHHVGMFVDDCNADDACENDFTPGDDCDG